MPVADGAVSEFDVRWDETGTWLAVWVADATDPSIGRLSLVHLDPVSGARPAARRPAGRDGAAGLLDRQRPSRVGDTARPGRRGEPRPDRRLDRRQRRGGRDGPGRTWWSSTSGAAPDGAGVRCALRSSLTHPRVRSLRCSGAAFAGAVRRRDSRLFVSVRVAGHVLCAAGAAWPCYGLGLVRPNRLVVGSVLTAALALVALPGLAGSRVPSPIEPVPAGAFQQLTILADRSAIDGSIAAARRCPCVGRHDRRRDRDRRARHRTRRGRPAVARDQPDQRVPIRKGALGATVAGSRATR